MMKTLRIGFLIFSLGITVFLCCAQDDKGLVEDIPSLGARNAIKKAYQMTDLCFTPLDSFVANPSKTYYRGEKYRGLVYSSVKETHTFVGMDVSFHTFMTALHNPRSVIYTENVSKPPYHGINCGAYYGTVCSGLVTYALGLKVYQKSYDIAHSDLMQLVDNQSSKGVQLADVLWRKGHVAMVTGIKRNSKTGKVVRVEISQAQHRGCYRSWKSEEAFNRMLNVKWKMYRYKYLNQNTEYTPLIDFVAVGDEKLTPFKYNDDICTNRGDKACYIVGDSVILNITKGFKELEIYKDSILYKTIDVDKDLDIVLRDLTYGDYKARLVKNKKRSDYTYWKVIDANVSIDQKRNLVKFRSENAIPVYAEFCSIAGDRSINGVFELSDEDIRNGYVDVSSFTPSLKKTRYVKVHFQCDYGRVTNKPIKWRIKK